MLVVSPTLPRPELPAKQPTDLCHEFDRGVHNLAGGVTVITSCDEQGARTGVTSTAVCPLGTEPPSLLVCFPRQTGLGRLLPRTKQFCVNALSRRQEDIAEAFADPTHLDRFDFGQWTSGTEGAPVLECALASFECSVDLLYAYPKHVIVVGRVRSVVRTPDPTGPLVCSTDRFGNLTPVDAILPQAS